VLYIKPRNTWVDSGDAIVVPPGVDALEIGATLGLVIGRTACRVSKEDAMEHVLGYVIVNDVSIPHASYYRPSLRCKARDTFCPIGPAISTGLNPWKGLKVQTRVNSEIKQDGTTADFIFQLDVVIRYISDAMTLLPGDVIATGTPAGVGPLVAGDTVEVTVEGIGTLWNPVVNE